MNKNFHLIWDEPPSTVGQTWSWNVSQILVKFQTKRRIREMENFLPQSSAIAAKTYGELVSPDWTQEGKNDCHLAAIRLQPLPTVSLEETQMRKHRILGPDKWGVYQKDHFSEPKLLHISIHRKALNSLSWDCHFLKAGQEWVNLLV